MCALKMEWNLKDLYESFEDPAFLRDYETLEKKAIQFQVKYRGKIEKVAEDIAKMKFCIEEYESLRKDATRLYSFPALRFYANTLDKNAHKWLQQVQERISAAEKQLVFFGLNIQKLPADIIENLIAEPELAPYVHFFENLLKYKPHTLSEEVEQVLNETSLIGGAAFVELRELHLGSQEYDPVTPPGENPVNTESELSSLAFHPDADTRIAAYRSIRKVYEKHNLLYGFILQKIAQDHKIDACRRKYKSTLLKQLMTDEVPEPVYRNVIEVTRSSFDLFQDYYKYKGEILGIPIKITDVHAPYNPIDVRKSYDDTIDMIYDAMAMVDSEFEQIVRDFIKGEYIDAAIRKGKRGGAFCWDIWGFHPYILESFTGTPDSWFTIAHELGHGIHSIYTNRAQRLLGSNPPMVLAEIASTFNELLLLDYLMETETDTKLRKALLSKQIEDSLNLLFRQTTISRLEEDIHEKAEQGAFDHEWINDRWMHWYKTLGGKSVEILTEHQFDWARIGHIYFKPFYCYNYCLSYMVSIACYIKYRDEGKTFIPRFKKLLSYGGSKAPIDALESIGIDPTDPVLMQSAIDYTKKLFKELKALQ